MAQNPWVKYFTDWELSCHCGREECDLDWTCMNPDLMDFIFKARDYHQFPYPLNSSIRCPIHNKNQGGEDDSAHLTGNAVDIRIAGMSNILLLDYVFKKIRRARKHGLPWPITGIGPIQHGPWHSRILHLDNASITGKRPAFWTYS